MKYLKKSLTLVMSNSFITHRNTCMFPLFTQVCSETGTINIVKFNTIKLYCIKQTIWLLERMFYKNLGF